MSDIKLCKSCKTERPITEFSSYEAKLKWARCKKCICATSKKSKEKNKEKIKIKAKIAYDKDPDKRRAASLRSWYKIKLNNPNLHYARVKRHTLARFQLTKDEFEKLILEQDNKCAICGKEETAFDSRQNKKRRLAIDHCHDSVKNGAIKVRGLLCIRCNPMLGYAQDSIEILKSAIQYLIKNS